MEKFSSVWTKVICFGFMLLKIELTNGTVEIPTKGTPYIGESFKLECHITPFTGTANWAKDGVTQTTCGATFCAPLTLGNYTFSYDATGISVTINPVSASDGGSWQCTHTSGSDSIDLTPTNQSNSPCDGHQKAILVLILCSYLPAIVKLLIILYLWCNQPKPPIGPREVTVIRIIVTAQQEFKSATQQFENGQTMTIPHSIRNEGFFYTIYVRAGELLQCAFESDASVLALSFKINDDVLYVKRGKNITLPTTLKVDPKCSTITWDLNGQAFEVHGQYFNTKVKQHTYGVYGIKMTFKSLKTVICIQNMNVQEAEPVPYQIDIYTYRNLMVLFVVIDIVSGVIAGIVTGLNRSTDGYCVSVIFIILMVLAPMIFFNCVEVVLFFKLIKRAESKESSGGPDSSIAMMSTSTKSTVSPNAGTTRSLTDGLSSSDVTATT